jgi:hypothetical protein
VEQLKGQFNYFSVQPVRSTITVGSRGEFPGLTATPTTTPPASTTHPRCKFADTVRRARLPVTHLCGGRVDVRFWFVTVVLQVLVPSVLLM